MKRARTKPNSGTAMVELSLLVSVLGLLMMGFFDFSRLFYASLTVADAARAGAQYGAASNTHSGDSSGMHGAAVTDAYDLGAETVTVTPERYCECQNGGSVDCVSGICAEGVPRIYVKVTAQHTFYPMTALSGILGSFPLSTQTTMRIQ